MKNKKLNLIMAAIPALVLIYYIFFVEDMSNLSHIIKSISTVWLIAAVLCMLIYWLLEAIVLHVITKSLHSHQKFFSTLNVSMIGQFYNCVTPFASGGQPMQAYFMVKDEVPLKIATTSLLAKFMIYQIDLILYTTILVILRITFFVNSVSGFTYLALIGYGVNLLVMAVLFSLAYFKKPTAKVIGFFIHLLTKIRIIKKPEKILEKIDTEVEQFHDTFVALTQKKGLLGKCLLLSTVQLTFYLLIPFTIFMGFGLVNPNADVLTMISAGAFVLMVSSFVPLPGAAGAAETSYLLFFSLFFPSGILGISTLIWRFITYYLCIFVGSIFSIRSGAFKKDKELSEKPIT